MNCSKDTMFTEFCISVVNWQLAVGFVSESCDRAQLNCSVCLCLQDVRKPAFVIKALLVYLMCT
jgi:hypothetical protein